MSLPIEQMKALAVLLEAHLIGVPGRPGTYTYINNITERGYKTKDGEIIARYGRSGSETYNLTLAGERIVIEKLGLEPRQDDEESDDWRCYKRRRYGGTEYPYKPTLSQALEAAVIAHLGNAHES